MVESLWSCCSVHLSCFSDGGCYMLKGEAPSPQVCGELVEPICESLLYQADLDKPKAKL